MSRADGTRDPGGCRIALALAVISLLAVLVLIGAGLHSVGVGR